MIINSKFVSTCGCKQSACNSGHQDKFRFSVFDDHWLRNVVLTIFRFHLIVALSCFISLLICNNYLAFCFRFYPFFASKWPVGWVIVEWTWKLNIYWCLIYVIKVRLQQRRYSLLIVLAKGIKLTIILFCLCHAYGILANNVDNNQPWIRN